MRLTPILKISWDKSLRHKMFLAPNIFSTIMLSERGFLVPSIDDVYALLLMSSTTDL